MERLVGNAADCHRYAESEAVSGDRPCRDRRCFIKGTPTPEAWCRGRHAGEAVQIVKALSRIVARARCSLGWHVADSKTSY
jgi:hypothetical protein